MARAKIRVFVDYETIGLLYDADAHEFDVSIETDVFKAMIAMRKPGEDLADTIKRFLKEERRAKAKRR